MVEFETNVGPILFCTIPNDEDRIGTNLKSSNLFERARFFFSRLNHFHKLSVFVVVSLYIKKENDSDQKMRLNRNKLTFGELEKATPDCVHTAISKTES